MDGDEDTPTAEAITARKGVKGEAPTEELLQEALDQPINKSAWEVPGEERSTPLPAQSNNEPIEDYDATTTTEPGTTGLGAKGYKAKKGSHQGATRAAPARSCGAH